jgi:O-antigen ligase
MIQTRRLRTPGGRRARITRTGYGDAAALSALLVAVGSALWRGGFFAPSQIAVAAAVAVAILIRRPPVEWRDPILAGLTAVAAVNLATAAVDGGATGAVLASLALPGVYVLARTLPDGSDRTLLWAVLAVALTAAAVAIFGFAARVSPYAERIDGVWRAAGTLEYPPALAVLAAAGLASALALCRCGELEAGTAGAAIVLLTGAAAASYDRAGLVLLALVAATFAWRRPGARRLVGVCAVAALLLGGAAIAVTHPDPARLRAELTHDPLASRTTVWEDAIRGIVRRPLQGYGPGRFPRIYATLAHPPAVTLAHDQVLEEAADAGIVAGLGALVVIAAGACRCARAIRAGEPEALALALAGLVILVASLYDFTWSFTSLAAIATIALARLRVAGPGRGFGR